MTRPAWLGLLAAVAWLVLTWVMLLLAGLGLDREAFDFVVDVLWAPWSSLMEASFASLFAAAQLGIVVYLILRWRFRGWRPPEP